MTTTLDVKMINPFLQSCISVVETVSQMKLQVGRPSKTDFYFKDTVYLIQVGVIGAMRGQVLLAMPEDKACEIASKMMFGMPVNELDAMSSSALNELGNMILGNTATIFSTLGTVIDITPPIATHGKELTINTDVDGIKVPMTYNNEEYLSMYICVYEDK